VEQPELRVEPSAAVRETRPVSRRRPGAATAKQAASSPAVEAAASAAAVPPDGSEVELEEESPAPPVPKPLLDAEWAFPGISRAVTDLVREPGAVAALLAALPQLHEKQSPLLRKVTDAAARLNAEADRQGILGRLETGSDRMRFSSQGGEGAAAVANMAPWPKRGKKSRTTGASCRTPCPTAS